MKRHKNLERAIVLGLMLSTGIYGTAFAETMNSGLWTDANKEVEAGEDLTINASGVGIGFDGTVNVMDGDLTVNATSNGILSGYGKDMQVQILANNVKIDADDNGIFTTWGDSILDSLKGYSGKVIIGSSDRNIDSLDITSGGQGIDNKWGKVEIYGKENSTINIHSTGTSGDDPNQAAINNSGSGDKGIVNVNGGDISLRADKGNGITNGSGITTINSNKTVINASVNGVENSYGTTTINGKDITINSKQNAVHNTGSGTINITSKGITQEGVSTLDDQYGYDISLVGEEENGILSDGTGTTNVIADNDIIIAGKENGILSNKDGKINVTAGNNNVIGQYTDEEGTQPQHISQTGINVSSGTVTITSGNENNIYGTQNGILATGKNSTINIDSEKNVIVVKNKNNGELNGIHVEDNATVNIGKKDTDKLNSLDINVSGINKAGKIYGVKVDKTGNFYVEANTVDIISGIKDKNNMPIGTSEETATNIGIYAAGTVGMTAKSDIAVSAYSDGNNYGNDAAIQTENGKMTINGAGNLTLNVKSGVNENSGIGNSTAMGIYSLGADSVTDISVEKGVNINVDGAGAIGINANYGQVNITAIDDIYFNVVSNNSTESKAWGAAAEGIMIYNYGDSEKDTKVSLNTEKDIQINITNKNLHENLNEGASVYGIAVCGSNSNGMTIGDLSGNNISIVATNNSVISNEDRDESVGILVQDSNDSRFIGRAKQNFLVAVNSIESNSYGIQTAQGNVDIYAEKSIILKSNSDKKDAYGIYAGGNAPNYPDEEDVQNIVRLESKNNVLLTGNVNTQGFGSGHAIQAENASYVDLNAIGGDNNVSGVIYAKDA
ncbi:hypothetical protein E0L01_09380, partial [Megamonas funiformis]|uniref:beta strand repeat-containing protein n=1 Tax=Megamonas funiformis TaxID=437897 RepID=UPI00142FEE38